jgi:hypothetical protein
MRSIGSSWFSMRRFSCSIGRRRSALELPVQQPTKRPGRRLSTCPSVRLPRGQPARAWTSGGAAGVRPLAGARSALAERAFAKRS